ncbi:hypothetical protein H6G54_26760 [Anabaena cylindrica FACHB-243]|uniref:Uncharacterized protein n=1 Tax=Anabaena cylindrica (strain ATCC 27899 / PCC 7122) TaxID=272123 RepID=K9ZEM1_ANACC|nr:MULTISPECIES: hypothetical protein [Anabaena]AFZ57658.1 hypothetical protein Anacy_2194 [Anabaena cylindrica PCC 7122]AZL96673.1 hypothetical protein [Anabaena sp. CCAP 1446/1C]MBD2421218.1 hypothetical protein [Anabaena cylindrica FACHB-243]MBY5283113.1 hypothetical protein [Anabaena sp. CCAP 1446/1C]MBY5310522.1 hypothetical protein [Anabaena sp. CCAP 1446/1C]
MPQPTFSDLFDNNTTLISSADFDAPTKTLTVVFSDAVTATQAFGAIVQSGQEWLVQNTDQSVNLASSAPTRNTSSRNGVAKDQINLSFQVYAPASDITYDPLQL